MKSNRLGLAVLAASTLVFTTACFIFSIRGPLKFSPDALPEAQVGIAYETRISISQNVTPAGEFSLSEGTLPKGLALEKVEGEDAVRIFGTPQEAGTFKFRVFVWCYGTNVNGQTGERDYSIVVR